jgi:hypothetical protein
LVCQHEDVVYLSKTNLPVKVRLKS